MRRVPLVLIAVVEIVVPDRIVAWGERRAFENPDAGQLRPWTLPMARLEGLAALWLAWNWEPAWPGVKPLFGTVGLPALLTPRPFLRAALTAAYENPETIELKPWVVPATRALGGCYLFVALWPGESGASARSER
ncbi:MULTISPECIES: hypothetical protein [Natrialbaceae]|uniref:hypothetical protein n=1 Tax=Natrialbaceae TaxID=1644061 RepID=UPI00207C6D63|nr:hypothetical protein [Natronococcus sp. CG52]